MMNLLIGIISEKLSELLDSREQNAFYELCQLMYDLENLLVWREGRAEGQKVPSSHFLWADYQLEATPWEGRIKATT